MATKIKMISLLFLFMTVTSVMPGKISAQGVSVGFQVFYDELSPYGTWVISPDYGYVWVPDVAPGFTPYSTNGYWMLTDEGWTWVSDYPWGWAPFHYGRWYMDPNYGAMWIPDYEWGPGWVTWRRSGGFYGWAPIGPGVSITVAYGNGYYVPDNQWTFVRDADFGRTNINRYYINNSFNVTIINNSTVINNTRLDRSRNVRYNTGPERSEVEKRSGRKFTPVAIQESSKPVQRVSNNQLQIYRPQVQRNTSSGVKQAPARVERLENVKTTEQRKEQPAPQKTQPARQQPQQQQRSPQQEKPQPQQKQQPQQQKQQPQQQKQQPQQQQRPPQQEKQQPSQQQKQQPQPQRAQPQQSQSQKQQPQPQKQQPPQQRPQPQQSQPQKQQPQQQRPQPQQQQRPPQPEKHQPEQPKPPKDKGE